MYGFTFLVFSNDIMQPLLVSCLKRGRKAEGKEKKRRCAMLTISNVCSYPLALFIVVSNFFKIVSSNANAAEILCAITTYAPPALATKISSPRCFNCALLYYTIEFVNICIVPGCVFILIFNIVVGILFYFIFAVLWRAFLTSYFIFLLMYGFFFY